ncbi:HAD hydrolase-like protein [Streptomyces violaceus]|uniref:HAD hydrolase-like protein n=1 Tax=Streptomyces violaceus TaxID=1936 RepID=UPI00381CC9A2
MRGGDHRQPDPQLFLKACADLGADPRTTLMVGDNPVRDGDAAACGLRTYILPAEHRTGERGLADVLRLVVRTTEECFPSQTPCGRRFRRSQHRPAKTPEADGALSKSCPPCGSAWVHGHRPFRYGHPRTVVIGCCDSVAEKWALFPGMS